jgi:predicted metal-dependent hydrolase
VRVSARAKRLSIKVFPRGRVEVVAPRRTSARAVKAFVEENQAWISRARESFAANYTPESFVLPQRIELRTIDARYIVNYQPTAGTQTVRYRCAHNILTLSGNTGDRDVCVKALKRWLSEMARTAFAPQLSALSQRIDTTYQKMHIRLQRTCWGSRSSSGTISINLSLLFLAPELTRYLMIHELCHGRHMNHSKRFWKLVSKYEPDYKNLDRRLGGSWRDVPNWLILY